MSKRSDARAPLSALVPVKNEAANLRDCLASVSRSTMLCRRDISLLRGALSLHTLDQNHVCSGGAVTHLARLAIFFAVQPLFGALR